MNRSFLFPLLTLVACGDVDKPDEVNEEEVITTVVLTFTPSAGGDPVEASWTDPESDGSPVVDDIVLSDADDYAVAVQFLNELEDPAEDITQEVDAESDQHQVFFTGSAVSSPATGDNPAAVITQAYADADVNGFPVGLESDVTTLAVGGGSLTVTLRHLPPQDGQAVKTADLAATVASSGLDALPGETDATVDFALSVE